MYYTSNGLILRTKVAAEADKLVTIYTSAWGKITALAPGAMKIKAKLGGATDAISEGEYTFYLASPQARPTITGAKLKNNFPLLLKDWRRNIIALCCCEVCEMLTPFNVENTQKYTLLCRSWEHLGEAENPWRIFLAFSLRFLRLSGYNFVEYLKNEEKNIPSREYEAIKKLAALSGKDIDNNLELDAPLEENVTNRIERYLNNYLPRTLSTKKFWKEVMSKGSTAYGVVRTAQKTRIEIASPARAGSQ